MLSTALYALGEAHLTEQRHGLAEKYATLLVSMEKPAIEQEIIALNADQLEDKLNDLEQDLKQTREEMALHPDVPRVSDVLAWLSSHPKVVVAGEEDRAIKLESLNYVMVKRPEKGKLKEQYQVRVDLEFSSPSATMAREFHDALLAPNQFVDPKNELKWSVHRGRYRATFFLKDRTKYPQHTVEGLANAGH
jgi:type IV pilus assembly protein PilM